MKEKIVEKDYSDLPKYSVEFKKVYIISGEKGMTKSIAETKAKEMLFNMFQEDERKQKEEPVGECIKFLISVSSKTKKKKKELTIKDKISLFDVMVEKTRFAKDYIIVFQYKFNLLTKITDEGLIMAIAVKESPFSADIGNELNMNVRRIYE